MSWFKRKMKKIFLDPIKDMRLFLGNSKKNISNGNQNNIINKNKTINKISNVYNYNISDSDSKDNLLKNIDKIIDNYNHIQSSINDDWYPRNINEEKIITDLIENGITGTNQKCKYISQCLSKLQKSNENEFELNAKNIKIAIEFLVTSNDNQKSYLIWAYILYLLHLNWEANSKVFLNNNKLLNSIREKYLLNSLSNTEFRYFISFNWNIDINMYITNKTSEIIKEEFLEYNENNNSNSNILWGGWNNIPLYLEDAARVLLFDLGVNFD